MRGSSGGGEDVEGEQEMRETEREGARDEERERWGREQRESEAEGGIDEGREQRSAT